ncbi:MAG: polysaccharide biosynthesis protein, partial [Alphaproteobacteria bacterium]|nr:polysaccharide biosynthesis protein [Alphaproteobacteria bacterium]
IAIARAATLTILIFLPSLFLLTRLVNLPRSFLVINWFVLIVLLGASRFAYRIYKDRDLSTILQRNSARRVPVLLIGAGDAAETFIRALARIPDGGYRVVGVIDEKGSRVGRDIRGVEVMGTIDDIPEIVDELKAKDDAPQRLILTKPRLEPELVRRLLQVAESEGLTLARLPRLTDFHAAEGERIDVRPVAVEDLLGRPRTVLDRDAMKALVAGKRVLVTGAGGTIGGELIRQVAAFGPARLCLLDHAEFNLYTIDAEAAERWPDVSRPTILGDVRDRVRLDAVMTRERPEIVFHAAALKHVPMVEANPNEGMLTNVAGTRNIADACRAAGVAAMVMISTDKAVNPTSVMGATKRLAESYCQALDIAGGDEGTRFVTVRFGNVLGSTGSVVPLFQRQLAKGGPLTVTHPEMKRYFMTVREAVELVLQASALGVSAPEKRGRIYVLDMGAPVRIRDLAETMIRLAGLRPGEDVEIVYT